ncbi:hypothetical protein BaRGS_00025688, partial [Batillaria attramentaria]
PSDQLQVPPRILDLQVHRDSNAVHYKRHKRAVTEVSLDAVTVNENGESGSTITTLGNSVDVPNSAQRTFTLYSTNPDSAFDLLEVRRDGQLLVATGAQLDYETMPRIAIVAHATLNSDPTDIYAIRLTINLRNVNEPARFVTEPSPYLATVSRTTGSGVTVIELTAVDPDQDASARIRYQRVSVKPSEYTDRFVLQVSDPIQDSGREVRRCFVRTAGTEQFTPPDEGEIVITISAQDEQDSDTARSVSTDVQVLVGVRPPQFYSLSYSGVIDENAQAQQMVSTDETLQTPLRVRVKTFQPGSGVTFSLLNDAGTAPSAQFMIDREGYIRNLQTFDYENLPNGNTVPLTVVATQTVTGTQLVSNTTVQISIKDSNDNRPIFESSQYQRSVREDIAIDRSVLTVKAIDADSGLNARVDYSVSGLDADFFYVETDEQQNGQYVGTIKVKQALDYDLKSGRAYSFQVVATDRGTATKSSETNVRINVINVNDEEPKFTISEGKVFFLLESAQPGQVVTQIQATDLDGDNVKYYFTPFASRNGKFLIDESSGLLTLEETITDDDDLFRLDITARDDGSCCPGTNSPQLSNETYIIVQVTDINTHKPTFSDCSGYSSSTVTEHAAVGTSVVTVSAQDGDRGQNGRVTYSITSITSSEPLPDNKFQVNASDGTITVAANIDRETTKFFQVTVKGEDGGDPVKLEGLCSFRVTVEDINDNTPVFDREQYVANVTSDLQLQQSFIVLQATDNDIGQNAEIEYSLIEDANGAFNITPSSGYVFLANTLTQGVNVIQLRAMAKDKGVPPRNSTVGVTVNIKSGSSRPPVWDPEWLNQNYVVPETIGAGQVVIPDLSCNSSVSNTRVEFQLMRADGTPALQTEFFSIRANGNSVSVLSTGNFDYEKATQHTVRIRCLNFGPVTLLTEIQPIVHLRDENNKVPQFEGVNAFNRYAGSVPENQTVGQEVLVITGRDDDVTPLFSQLTFAITDENGGSNDFEIVQNNNDNTAVVRTKRTFDREIQQYYPIFVVATDGAASALPGVRPGHNNMTVSVEITISDINDNPPSFNQTIYYRRVNEELFTETVIEPPITATDPDSSDQGRLQYLIVSGNERNTFGVKAGTGALFVLRRLDYEGSPPDRSFTLRLQASDGKYSAETTVRVDVNDVNDNFPVFHPQTQDVNDVVEEDDSITSNNPRLIATMNATDADTSRDNRIQYFLEGYGSGIDGNPELFRINQYTGDLFLVSKLDRDLPRGRATYVVTVAAQDEPGNNPLTGYASVNVNPLDINDNDPYFVTDPLVGTVMEGSPRGTSVVLIQAGDPDYQENGTVNYAIDRIFSDQGDKTGYFTINNKGLIKTNVDGASLDREDDPTYSVVLRLNDGGNPSRSTTGTVTINLGDINDNVPIFEQLIYTRTIQENHPLTVEIVSVAASDKDEAATLYYSFSEDTNIFRVVDTRSNTGSVRLYQELDYENADQRFFNLTVIVRDENPSHTASCYVEITVTDFNDNAPVIVPEDHSVSVKEDISPGTWLANFTASDKDSGINSEFEFAIDRQSDRRRFFSINATTGEVHTRRKLDRETVPQHVLTILAIDKGDPPLTGTAKLTVNLEDVNDNYPTFLEDYQPHVQENLPAISNREVQLIFGFDPDGSPFGPPFGFAEPTCAGGSNTCPCAAKPSCEQFQFNFDASGDGGNGTGLVTTSNTFDREQQKYYTIPIVMWDMRGVNQALSKTGTNTLTVTIADVNDNPQSPGHQDVFVYNYKGLFGDFVIGRVYVTDLDDWDLPDKTFTYVGPEWMKAYFSVDPNLGDITMKKGVPSNTFTTPYKFEVDVYDRVDDTTVRSTVSVVIHELSEQAVMSSGAVRLTGTSAEEFIKRSQNGAGESKYDNFRTLMAAKLGVDVNNVEIISVMDVGEFTDVRYSAHGSPYYQSSQTDSVVVINKQEFENLGLSIAEVPIDACAEEEFEGGCYNFLNITGQPAVVNSNGTSFVGVEVMVQAREGCRALEYPDPVECSGDYCYNGGTCLKDDFGVLSCQCHDGFDGSRCQQLRHSFDGNSFAMYPTLEQCEDSQTSIEFITTQDDGLLLYNGPIAEVVGDQPRDFITLQLVSGYPVLYIDHGSGHLRLSLNSIKLSDGAWHRIDILRTGRNVEMIQDSCKDAVTTSQPFPDTTNCRVSGETPGVNSFLNVATLLQLGGRSFSPSYQPNIGTAGFNGCVRNLRHNNKLYDLHYKKMPSVPSGENGCQREDDICGTKCGDNGICSANIRTQTTIRDLREKSYLEWTLERSFITAQRLAYQMDIHIMFRTRDDEGVLFTMSSGDGNQLMTLEINERRLRVLYAFGDGQHILELTQAEVSNGQWHVARVQRVMRQVTLTLDDGEGRNYVFSPGDPNRPAKIIINEKVHTGAAVSIYSNGATTLPRDLTNTCIQDIRLNNVWFPMKTNENSITQGVSQTGEQGVSDGCQRDPTCVPACVPPKGLCYPLWDIAECRSVVCTCEGLWYGQYCQFYGKQDDDDVVGAGLTAGGIAAIVVSIIVVLLIVLLAFILLNYFRKRQTDREKIVFENDDDYDIRENVMFYDEEGAGEEDQEAYDLAKLPPVESETALRPQKAPRNKTLPARRGIPDDRPDVGGVLSDRLRDAEDDPDAPPYDTTQAFNDEGSGSTAGSLSSLNTTSSDASQDYDYLNDWGPKFAKLADMYGAGHNEPEDL